MTLHLEPELFSQLIILTSRYRSIPESAVRRDYWIVYMFMQLSKSDYVEKVVFKGALRCLNVIQTLLIDSLKISISLLIRMKI